MRNGRIFAVLVALALIVGACGDGATDTTATDGGTAGEGTTTTGGDTGTTIADVTTTTGGEEPSGQIVFSSWGGAYSETWKVITDEFTSDTGIEVVFDDAPGEHLAQLDAQARAGRVTWDLVEFGAAGLPLAQAIEADLLQPLPEELDDLNAQYLQPGWFTEYSIGATGGLGNVITCLPEFERCPTTPVEFWDVESFPGERSMWREGALANILTALHADGVELSMNLFPFDDADYDRAFSKLDEIRPHIAVFFSTGDQQQQLLRDGEVDILLGWDGRMTGLQAAGLDVQINPTGASSSPPNQLAIPKDAPNSEAALAFIEWYVQRPNMGAILAEGTGYPTPHLGVEDEIDPSQLDRVYMLRPGVMEQIFIVDTPAFLAMGSDAIAEIESRYFEWLEG